MKRFLIRRILLMVPIVLGVSLVVFLTVKATPGDPVVALLGADAPEESKDALRERLGLGQPIYLQYLHWLGNAATGDLGASIVHQKPALPLVVDAFANTAILALLATIFALVIGVGLGTVSALRKGRVVGKASAGLSMAAVSMPQYTVALVLIIYVALKTGWFPVSGMTSGPDAGLLDMLHHAVLPAFAACLPAAGVIGRIFRAALLDAYEQDFVEAMRARGVPERRILLHAMHNAVPALLTVTGLQIGHLLGGIVFVETIFAWPGLGLLFFRSISNGDLPVIQAGVLIVALAFVLINVLVDTVHALVDTRVRTQ